MEDEYSISHAGRLLAVFDGHGGSQVSKHLRQTLPGRFDRALRGAGGKGGGAGGEGSAEASQGQASAAEVEAALSQALREAARDVERKPTWQYQGTTAVCVYVHDEGASDAGEEGNPKEGGGADDKWKGRTLVVANVGDSRAVLSRGRKALDLTTDHKPNDKKERERVEKLGGTVQWHGYFDARKRPIPGTGVWRINGNLAVARAIGDASEQPFVGSEADTGRTRCTREDEFVVLASDGLWDVMGSQEAVSFVHQTLSGSVGALVTGANETKAAATQMSRWASEHTDDVDLIRAALEKRKKRMGKILAEEAMRRGSGDNICVMVLWLKSGNRR
jgi:serine/threonine protein phosphatase PrpC